MSLYPKSTTIRFRLSIKARSEALGAEEGEIELHVQGGDPADPPSVKVMLLNAKDCTIDFGGAVLHRLMSNVLLRDLGGAEIDLTDRDTYDRPCRLSVTPDARTDYVRMFDILRDETQMLLRHDWPAIYPPRGIT